MSTLGEETAQIDYKAGGIGTDKYPHTRLTMDSAARGLNMQDINKGYLDRDMDRAKRVLNNNMYDGVSATVGLNTMDGETY
jgi:hypothetical protein